MNRPKLINISKQTEVVLDSDKFLVGRGVHNSCVIEDILISRTHCIFEKVHGGWTIIDKSSNGTLVNNRPLQTNQPVALTHGDVIILSENSKFVFSSNEYRQALEERISEEEVLDIADALVAADTFVFGSEANGNNMLHATDADSCTSVPAPQSFVTVTDLTDKYDRRASGAGSSCPVDTIDLCCETDVAVNEVIVTPTVPKDGGEKSGSLVAEEINRGNSECPNNKSLENIENELQCSICTELFIKAVTLNCSHTFCNYCITEWKKKQSICPICRAKISAVAPTIVIDNFIAKVLETAPEDVQRRRKEAVEQRQNQNLEPKPRQTVRTTRATAAAAAAALANVVAATEIELSSGDEDASVDDLSDASTDWEGEYDDDNWYDGYNGTPGAYYGGYGHCYVCGDRGHWANGCPNR